MRPQGLGNVIIRARVQAGYPVGLIVAGRQHNHRYHGPLAEPLQNMKSIQNRKHHVQQNQIVPAFNGIRQAAGSGVDGVDMEILRRQELRDQGTQRDIVIDQEDRSGMLLRTCAFVLQTEPSPLFWRSSQPSASPPAADTAQKRFQDRLLNETLQIPVACGALTEEPDRSPRRPDAEP